MSDRTFSGTIFVRTDAGLTELRESAYDSESTLQRLIAEYPSLLAGDQIDASSPRRLALVKREMGVPSASDTSNRWSLDHLFIDQDGVPTLIEVKRSIDTRIRPEVVGQMLDYAANAVVHWPVDRIRSAFDATHVDRGLDPDEVLRDLVEDDDPDRFWATVQTNLQAGRIRLVFVADEIPTELRRVIEFLNVQMSPAEVLALEVRQYVGQGIETLVPRIIGQTSAAQQRKSTGSDPARHWDEPTFFDALATNCGDAEVTVARRLLEWGNGHGLRIWWGRGRINGSFFAMLDHPEGNYFTFSVWTSGKVEIQFQRMYDRPGNQGEGSPEVLRANLNRIPGVAIPESATRGKPGIPLGLLADAEALRTFIDSYETYLRAVRDLAPGSNR